MWQDYFTDSLCYVVLLLLRKSGFGLCMWWSGSGNHILLYSESEIRSIHNIYIIQSSYWTNDFFNLNIGVYSKSDHKIAFVFVPK